MPAGASNPVMVTALADGTKAYVVSNQNNATCPTAGVNSPCLTAEVTTIRTSDNTVIGQPISLGAADLNAGDIDPGALAACSGAQFRTSIASSVDSTKVYAAVCDAGMISIIRTSDDTLVLPMHSPLSTYAACSVPPQAPPPQPCPAGPLPPPPPQNPVWVVAGR
jgi:DNA-binding beta-propeller fold protein YncE